MTKLKGGIFLSVKDLMILNGKNNYESCRREHQAIRDCLGRNKRKLTIREYCQHEGLIYDEVAEFLNQYR